MRLNLPNYERMTERMRNGSGKIFAPFLQYEHLTRYFTSLVRIYAWALSEVFHELSGHGIMGESEAARRDPAKPEEKENPAGSAWGSAV